MSDLKELRLEINDITRQMVELFERRLDVSKEVARYKKTHDMPIFQPEREKEILDMYEAFVDYPKEVVEFLKFVMDLSKKVQKEEISK